MSLQDQIDLLPKLGQKGATLPGLELDSILDNLAKKQEQVKASVDGIEAEKEENIERGQDPEDAKEEAEAKKKEVIDKFKENMRYTVDEKISVIKQNLKVVMENTKSVIQDVKSVIKSFAIPAAVTVPPSVTNPAYALELAKIAKNSITRAVSTAITAFAILLKASIEILFELPSSVLDLFKSIDAANAILSAIPV